ncbi:MAG: bifunctional phosphoglucose/phosphomannose isomerase [Armatimonadota bacterium]|nr:MAG: bifunctional phosphoglucose/phosphomannose isomerase [Armatimonadota bacterium]
MLARSSDSGSAPRADLDDRSSYQCLDPVGMLDFAIHFPSQLAEAAEIGRTFAALAELRAPRQIVLAGMGGSAVAGDFLVGLCEKRARVPFVVCRNYHIPAFVGPETLFIASSHSGDTEETLAATSAALRRGADILCITTGGKLRQFAQRHREKSVRLLQIPRTYPSMPPRAALGYSLIPLVYALELVGAYPGAGRQVRESIALLARQRNQLAPDVPTPQNPAKRLAKSLFGKIPWVQGTVGPMSAAAYRWRCQFNENSKTLAYSSEYPELNHNEVVGWELAERFAGLIEVVVLRSPDDYWRNRERVSITEHKLIGPKAPVHVIEAEGRSPLAQLMWVVYLGDFTSLYLAFLNGVDPAAMDSINILKAHLEGLRRPRK